MRDWLARSKENAKEYGRSRYKKQPFLLGLRWSTQDEILPALKAEADIVERAQLSLIEGAVLLHQNLLEIHPLGLARNLPSSS